MHRGIRVAATTTLVLAMFAAGGCALRPAQQPAAKPFHMPAQAEVQTVALHAGDFVTADMRLYLPKGGRRVVGEVTLDQCGGHFPSEAARIARRQMGVVVRGMVPGTGYSNEVVVYTGDAAAQALSELRAATRACPTGRYLRSAVAGTPPLRYEILANHSNPARLPVHSGQYILERLTARSGRSLYLAAVFQQKGDVLDGSYLVAVKRPSRARIAELMREARVTGTRLAQLP